MRYYNTSNAKATQDNLAIALKLAKAGLPIFPARASNKRPHVNDWPNVATTDAARLRAWWRKWPNAMPAIPTGERSGIAVLDIDMKDGKDGMATLRDLGFDSRSLSPVSIPTPTGGDHRYYRYAEGLGSNAGKIGPGVDMRAAGGFVVAPGAFNGNGAYGALDVAQLTDLPGWPDKLKPPPRVARKSSGERTGLPFAEVADALMAVPNDDSNGEAESRDWWLHIGMALHHETDGGEEGLEAFQDWSELHKSYDYIKTMDAWRSFEGEGRTAGTILREANQYGWHNAIGHERRLAEDELLIDQCWTPEELAAKYKEALDAETQAAIEELVGVPAGSVFFAPASDWAGLPVPPRKWHVQDLIPGNTVTLLGGDGGTGKSLLALQLAVATATGTSWIGRDIEQPGKALVLSAEDDIEELFRRWDDICESEGLSMSSLSNLLIRSTAGEETLLATLDGKTNMLKATAIYETVCASMKRERPALLVLDTLADLHAGNENDRAHARQFIGLLRHLAIEYQCAVVLLAHPSLTGMNSGSGLSGSTAWNASVRSRLYLKRVKDGDYEADPDARTLETMKANYGPTGGIIPLTWVDGVFVPDLPGDDREDRNAKAERVFLKQLAELTKQGRRVSPNNGSNLASKVFSELSDSEGVSKKAFKTAMEDLLRAGRITVEVEGPPSKRRQYLVRDQK